MHCSLQMYDDEEVYDRVSLPHGSELPEKSTLRPFERLGRPSLLGMQRKPTHSLAATRMGKAAIAGAAVPPDLADDEEVVAAVEAVQRAEVALGGPPHLPGAGVGAVSYAGLGHKSRDNLAEMQAVAAKKALDKKLRAIELKKAGISTKAPPKAYLRDHVGALLHGFPSDVPEDRMTEYQRASRLDQETLDAMGAGCDRRHLRKKNSMTEHRETYVRIKKTMGTK